MENIEVSENIIEIKNVCKSYKMGQEVLPVLKDNCLNIERGEFIALLGPSGSGKSTLMNILGCMDKPTSGEYYLNGKGIHSANERELTNVRNSEIGFIFQRYQLIPKYTVLQNVLMPLLVRGMSRHEATDLCVEKLKMLGLEERLSHKPSELSGGQQQRVAIARALVGSPSILLADEPTGALDSTTGKEVLELFKQLHEMGNTIIMITHDLQVAQNAQRVVRIVDGVLQN